MATISANSIKLNNFTNKQQGEINDILFVGRGKSAVKVKIVALVGNIETKASEIAAKEAAAIWFNNDYQYGTTNHILVVVGVKVWCAIKIN